MIRGEVDVPATSHLGLAKASGAGSAMRSCPSALVVLLGSFCGTLRKHNSAEMTFHCDSC